MHQKEIIDACAQTSLFVGVPPELLHLVSCSEDVTVCRFRAQQRLCRAHAGEGQMLGILTKGRVQVLRNRQGGRVLLNELHAPAVFGVASLFGGDGDFITDIEAKTAVRAVLIPQEVVCRLVHENGTFAENYIRFLSERVRFLNERIAAFTAGSAVARLGGYLASLPQEEAPAVSRSSLAVQLDIGRASLYRALEVLRDAGGIALDGRTIRILNREICRTIT